MPGLDMVLPPGGAILQASELGTSTVAVTIEDRSENLGHTYVRVNGFALWSSMAGFPI